MSAPTLSSQIYDRNAYPLEELTTSARASLLHRCQQDLADRGATVLPNFVKHDTLTTIISEVTPYLADAFYKPKVHNVYLVEPDAQFTKDHPRNREVSTNSATLGYHGIAQDSALDRLYKDSSFRQFIADALGFETLYPYRDPLSPVNVLVYKPGTTTGWHFDSSKFTVTLLLRAAESGGRYDYAPFIRSQSNPGYEAVERILDGSEDGIEELQQSAGDLVLFRGAMTLHRVTEVLGSATRLVGVFSYSPDPDAELNAQTRRTFYGRER